MRKIREILRLKFELGMGDRKIARSCSISHSTVNDMVRRAKTAGLTWPLPEELDDASLEAMLYSQKKHPDNSRPLPDMKWMHKELRKKGVTLQLLWMEYKEQHPEGYQYSQFCDIYRRWKKTLDVTLRQNHRAGEKLFVDFAGTTVPVINPETGEVWEAYIFTAVHGASNYTYAEATRSQDLFDWINAHVNAFEFFKGVAEVLVPDNLASGVTKSCRYEPDINTTYLEMARHYGTVVVPARAKRPRDKSKAENGVLQVTRWILAAVRNHTFFSLSELNRVIGQKLEELNKKPFQKLEGSRHSWFLSLDKPALKPLPAERYEYAVWKKLRINNDYHVEIDNKYYSVPYQLVKKQVDVRISCNTVEIFYKNVRVTSHCRLWECGKSSTYPEHRHPAHQEYLKWTPERLINWAKETGPSTAQVIQTMLDCPVTEQNIRPCVGIMRLSEKYSPNRLESACARAINIKSYSYKSIKSILKNGLDGLPLEERPQNFSLQHENLRGAAYYGEGGDKPC